MRAQDILTAQYAKAIDLSSGGRQMPGHYGNVANNLVSLSSPVATQMLHAVGIALAAKIRKTGQVAMTSMGEGSSNQGDVHEGLNFAAIHKLPFILVRREQRLRDQRAGAERQLARSGRRGARLRLRHPRASSSTARTSSPATARPRRRSIGRAAATARRSSRSKT